MPEESTQEMKASSTAPPPSPPSRGLLGWIEWAGNKLPDPAMLFVWALVITWVLSWLLSYVQFEEYDPRTGKKDVVAAAPVVVKDKKNGKTAEIRREHLAMLAVSPAASFPASIPWQSMELGHRLEPKKKIQVKNQLTGTAMATFLSKLVHTFTSFHPLGVVLVALLGVGVAEHTGFINAIIKGLLNITPGFLLTPMLILVGIVSHSAGDTGYVLVIPLGGVIFAAAGRHPVAGVVCAFAAVSGGFSANFIVSGLDPLLQGFTQQAAQIYDPERYVNPLCNYFFMAASCTLIVLIGWFITDFIVEPRLRRNTPIDGDAGDMPTMDELSSREVAGLWAGVGSLLICFGALTLACWPMNSPFRSASGDLLSFDAPFMQAIVPFIFLFFLIPGIVYGYVAGTVKSHRDVVKGMSKSMSTMGYYLVLAFCAAQFIYAFNESNLGVLLAIKGARFLQSLGLEPQYTIVGIIILASVVNLLVGSASAKWAMLAPIFVPMLMEVGISPELTQVAYRIGDSSTNIITPLMPYFPLVVVFAQRYAKETGIGTMISHMLVYSIAYLLTWTILLIFYWQVLELPLGFGADVDYAPYTYP